jgi:alpha-L-arabinofuranosidase
MFLQMRLFRLDHLLSVRLLDWNRPVLNLCRVSTLSLLIGMVLSFAAPVHAQLKTTAHVETAKGQAVLYTTSIGVSGDRWDAKAFDSATVKLLQDIGITSLRFPGNNGIDALYHWSTGAVINPYTNDRAPAFAPERKLHALVPVIDQLGTALITVNYGSNLDGTGGGEPAEAAAWVAYVNGKPDSTQVIGKDSKGNDWKTVGYWAGLRASAPLATDDGYNALRIKHPDPMGILLWAVGHEPWNNGFYGQAHTLGSDADNAGLYKQSGSPEPDLHLGPVPTSKDWGRRSENAKVGPQAYGAAVVEFAKAMKAVDPTILVGASLTLPIRPSLCRSLS